LTIEKGWNHENFRELYSFVGFVYIDPCFLAEGGEKEEKSRGKK
jgi:hypothetical protein